MQLGSFPREGIGISDEDIQNFNAKVLAQQTALDLDVEPAPPYCPIVCRSPQKVDIGSPEVWKELAGRFRSEATRKLRMAWYSIGDEYDLEDGSDEDRGLYISLASMASARMGYRGPDPVGFLLERLRLESPVYAVKGLGTHGPDKRTSVELHCVTGVIESIFTATANYCVALEARALAMPCQRVDGPEFVRSAVPPVLTGEMRNRVMVDNYIEEVFNKTGKRITRTMIWKKARYKTRTEFERWQRCDKRATKAAAGRFEKILREMPHLD